eukprot:scaffold80913_cov102-Phaeocystis_antarctica.AAC.2
MPSPVGPVPLGVVVARVVARLVRRRRAVVVIGVAVGLAVKAICVLGGNVVTAGAAPGGVPPVRFAVREQPDVLSYPVRVRPVIVRCEFARCAAYGAGVRLFGTFGTFSQFSLPYPPPRLLFSLFF